jgi:hypothetical protein
MSSSAWSSYRAGEYELFGFVFGAALISVFSSSKGPPPGSLQGVRDTIRDYQSTGPVHVGRIEFTGGTWYGDMKLRHILWFDAELTFDQLADLFTELGGSSAVSGPVGTRVFESGIKIGATTRSVDLPQPLPAGDYRAYVRVWSLSPGGVETTSPWFSAAFEVTTPPTPLGDPDSVVAVFNPATGAAEITITPSSTGPVGDEIVIERIDDGLAIDLARIPANGPTPVLYVDATAPFHANVIYRARATSATNEPPSDWTSSAVYREDSQVWWMIQPGRLDLSINPRVSHYAPIERRNAAVGRLSGRAVASVSGSLGMDIELGIWLDDDAAREALEAFIATNRRFRLVDIHGIEYWMQVVGDIDKIQQRAQPREGSTTRLRDFWEYRMTLSEVGPA